MARCAAAPRHFDQQPSGCLPNGSTGSGAITPAAPDVCNVSPSHLRGTQLCSSCYAPHADLFRFASAAPKSSTSVGAHAIGAHSTHTHTLLHSSPHTLAHNPASRSSFFTLVVRSAVSCRDACSTAQPHTDQHWSGSLRRLGPISHILMCAGRWFTRFSDGLTRTKPLGA